MEDSKNPYDFSGLPNYFQSLIKTPKLIFQILDLFPMPVQIFAPDGILIFSNRFFLELNNIRDVSLVLGKYNLKNDPVCNDQLGMREVIQRAFRGEAVAISFPSPIQDLVDRGVIDGKPYESALVDAYLYPIWDSDRLVCIVNVIIVKSIYKGHPDVAKAKEYIDSHWQDGFDANAVARAVCVSQKHLAALFRQSTGEGMKDYYKKVKVEHIKEKLMDKRLSIAEAFSLCGEDNRGAFGRTFKKLTGMTPKEYKNSLK